HNGQSWSEPKTIASAKQMLAPALAVNNSAQWIAWSQRDNDNWDIYVRQIGPILAEKIKVTSSAAVDRNVSAAITSSGEVWVAWQSDRNGNQDIYAAVTNKPNLKPIRISSYDGSDYNPSILAIGNKLYIAWDSYRKGNYDIFLKCIEGETANKPFQISDSSDTDKDPQLSSDEKGRVWIVYNNSKIKGNSFGRRYNKTYRIRCLDDGLLYKPTAPKTNVWDTEVQGEEFPALNVSEQYGTRLVSMATQKNLMCWTPAGRQLEQDRWSQPMMISGKAFSPCRRPAIVSLPDGQAWLIWVNTNRYRNPDRSTNKLGSSTINAIKLDKIPADKFSSPTLEEIVLKSPKITTVANQDRRTINYQGRSLNFYFGDLHAHSSLSLCGFHLDSAPEDQYAFTHDNAGNDFMALTDHGMHINDYEFHTIKKLANTNNQPQKFVAFMAQEWSSCRFYHEGYGHKNIIYMKDDPDRYFSPLQASILPKPYACPTPKQMWETLRGKKAITIPHQLADSGWGAYTDWSYMDEELQPVAEIFQGRGSYEFKGTPRQAGLFEEGCSLQDAWAMGHMLGVIASPDHGGGWGRAAILAEDLTRKSLFEALKKRRCYGTTMAHILLDFRVNGHLMGEKITVDSPTAPRRINVVSKYRDLERLVLYRNNREILRQPITDGRIDLEFVDPEPLDANKANWYYVRVEAKPGKYGGLELAWSSPVWVSVKK
ncbi:MAG: DUF3604 domain-containing protein, partial [Planctomycetota bacterium]